MRHGGWEYVVEFEVPVCGEIRVSTVEFVGPQQPNGEMAQWGNMAQRGNGPKGKVWVHTRK